MKKWTVLPYLLTCFPFSVLCIFSCRFEFTSKTCVCDNELTCLLFYFGKIFKGCKDIFLDCSVVDFECFFFYYFNKL